MKKEQVLELMSALDPGLVEEAALQAPAGRRIPRLARAGLIAACLCLVLVGTGAAAMANGWIRVFDISSRQINRRDGSTVSIAQVELFYDGKAYVPWERFSQQCPDFLSGFYGMPQYKGFDSWNELEEFLGLNIIDNPILDQAEPAVHDNNFSLGGRTETGSCFVGFFGNLQEPDFVYLNAVYKLKTHDNRHFYLSLSSSLETAPRELDERRSGRVFWKQGEEQIALTTEDYTTPSGLQTVFVTTSSGNIGAFFQVNSAYFELSAYCDDEHMDEGIRIVKEVLDAFSFK